MVRSASWRRTVLDSSPMPDGAASPGNGTSPISWACPGGESFRENGGDVLTLVPAVNASDAWADAVVTLAREASAWLPSPGVARHA